MDPYQYTPAAGDTIRVFELQAPSGSPCHVQGRLHYTSLEQAPPFLGLSYSWGAEAQDVPLDCDGSRLLVTRSLANAIRKLLRLTGADGKGRSHPDFPTAFIWIDQICINQNDPDERSHQVKYMGDIYSRAVRTVIWLGADLVARPQAWHLIDSIYQVFEREHPRISSIADIKPEIYSQAKHAEYRLPCWGDAAWGHLDALISLPWFSRIWVIQETVLSRLDPILIHGNELRYFERLGWVASWLRQKGYLRRPEISRQFKNVDTIANIRRSHTRWTFDVLLMSTSAKFQAKDQRDKIFALLGMAEETHEPAACPPALQADYRLDLAQVYERVAVYLFSKHRSLVSLTRCISAATCAKRYRTHDVRSGRMPSWVPNWSDVAEGEEVKPGNLVWIAYPPRGGKPVLGFPSHYNASKGLPLASWTLSGSRLSVRALRVDTVQKAWPFPSEDTNPETRESESDISEKHPAGPAREPGRDDVVCQYLDMARSSVNRMNAEDLVRCFVRATTADQSRLGGVDPEQMCRDGAAYLHEKLRQQDASSPSMTETRKFHQTWAFFSSCFASRKSHARARTSRGSVESERQELVATLDRLGKGGRREAFEGISRVYLINRAFLVTAQGRLGIGPGETRPGDLVLVIPGGGVPYVVSSGEVGKYTFVGECWVDGLMSGEAVDAWQRGEMEYEGFELL